MPGPISYLLRVAFESCYANKRLAVWPTFLVWIIAVSCPLQLSEAGKFFDSGYFATKGVWLNEAQTANIAGKRRKGLY